MGNWHANIALKGVNPSDVLGSLSELGHLAAGSRRASLGVRNYCWGVVTGTGVALAGDSDFAASGSFPAVSITCSAR